MPTPASEDLCLGVILLLVIFIAAFLAIHVVRKRRGRGDKQKFVPYAYDTPAEPVLEEAGGFLVGTMRRISSQVQRVDEILKASPGVVPNTPSILMSNAMIGRALDGAVASLTDGQNPPQYADYYAVYDSLSSADSFFIDAAAQYVAWGDAAAQAISRDRPLGAGLGVGAGGDAAEVSGLLQAIGGQIRVLIMNVHRLGVAADLE